MTDYIKEIRNISKFISKSSPVVPEMAVSGAYIFLGLQLEKYFGLKGAAYHAAGAGAYLTGMLADIISTIKVMKADNKFYRKHGFHVACEGNPLLPEHPTAKDVIGITKKGAARGLFDFLAIFMSAFLPPVGFGVLAARSFAYSNNKMAAKQVKLADKLLEERMPNASMEEKKKFLEEILKEKEAKVK